MTGMATNYLSPVQSNILGQLAHGNVGALGNANPEQLAGVINAVVNHGASAIGVREAFTGYTERADATTSATLVQTAQPFAARILKQQKAAVLADVREQNASRPAGEPIVLTQMMLGAMISAKAPATQRYAKDAPVLGYVIRGGYADIPEAIRNLMGNIDRTTYSDEWFQQNQGSVVTLQMSGKNADFYPQKLSNYQKKYKQVPVADVASKNAKMLGRMRDLPGMAGILDTDPNVVAILNIVPATMYRRSDVLRLPKGRTLQIEVPAWGPGSTQTSNLGQGAYFVYEVLKMDESWRTTDAHHYMVNAETKGPNKGKPIAYVPV